MIRTLIPLVILALAAPAAAQNQFRATLDGSQETPPVTTDAGGWGTAFLNPDGSVTYEVRTWGLTATDAHIHLGAPGVPGGIIVPLSGGPTAWSGTSAPLSASDEAAFRAGNTYFNVHTTANPGGEVRGQILPISDFGAVITGDQEVPPTGSAARGSGTFMVNADRTITYDVQTSGITATDAHIHTGPAGVSGGILFPLSGGPTSWSGTTAAMTEAQFEDFQASGMYVNIHSAAFPGGEIRGQIVPVGQPYGFACSGTSGYTASLSSIGAPRAGGTMTVEIAGGVPNGSGFLGVSTMRDAALQSGCQRLIALPAARVIPISLGPAGGSSMVVTLPNAAVTGYLQFGGFSGGALQYTSNALEVDVQAY